MNKQFVQPSEDLGLELEVSIRKWRKRAIRVVLLVIALMGLPAWSEPLVNAARKPTFTPL